MATHGVPTPQRSRYLGNTLSSDVIRLRLLPAGAATRFSNPALIFIAILMHLYYYVCARTLVPSIQFLCFIIFMYIRIMYVCMYTYKCYYSIARGMLTLSMMVYMKRDSFSFFFCFPLKALN